MTIKRKQCLIILATLLLIAIIYNCKSFTDSNHEQRRQENFLDGCVNVYLDVGSNVGIQVRKLFEPHLYPEAKVKELFDKQFGRLEARNRNGTCAVGFEPNPRHTERLQNLEKAYSKCGYRVHFMTETAVSDRNGTADFVGGNRPDVLDPGGTVMKDNDLFRDETLNRDSVRLIQLSNFLNNVVAKRSLPVGLQSGRVVMKMDIEGSEMEIVPDLIYRGSLQHINYLMIEWHFFLYESKVHTVNKMGELKATLERIQNYTVAEFLVDNEDDESYFNSDFQLPICKK